MLDSPPNLDDYRSIEELQRLGNDVQDAMEALEREADGRPFNEAARNKFAGLATTRTEIGKRLKELRLRHATPTGSGRDPARNESMDDVYYPSDRGNGARRPDEPRHIAEGREAGLRAIDGQAGILTARAGDRLERAVRSDHSGVGGRYLEAVANPAYNSAFGKMLSDSQSGHLRFSPAEVEACGSSARGRLRDEDCRPRVAEWEARRGARASPRRPCRTGRGLCRRCWTRSRRGTARTSTRRHSARSRVA